MDLGNIHLYTGGFVPGYRTDAVMREERKVCGNRPMILSETGWHNANNSTATHYHTPEDVAGVYAPRLLLEYFIRRVPKIAIFELLDEWPDPGLTNHEAHFGMLRHDFSPKPAFVALANLAAIARRASGPGTPFDSSREAVASKVPRSAAESISGSWRRKASSPGWKIASTSAMGSLSRRRRRNQRAARSTSRPASTSISACTAEGTRLSRASIAAHSASKP